MTPNERLLGARIGGLTTLNRYGGDFLAARARAGARWRQHPETLREHMRSLAKKGGASAHGDTNSAN
jgi:hypothetical protein